MNAQELKAQLEEKFPWLLEGYPFTGVTVYEYLEHADGSIKIHISIANGFEFLPSIFPTHLYDINQFGALGGGRYRIIPISKAERQRRIEEMEAQIAEIQSRIALWRSVE